MTATLRENNEQTDDVYDRIAGISVSAGHTTSKVRRLFNEKKSIIPRNKGQLYRASTGIDRSYPLKPLNDVKQPEAISKEFIPSQYNSDYCKLYGKLPNLGGELLSSKYIISQANKGNNFTSITSEMASSVNDKISRITNRISNVSISASKGSESSKTNVVGGTSSSKTIVNGTKTNSTPSSASLPTKYSINNANGNSKLVQRSKLSAPPTGVTKISPVMKSTNVVIERKPTPPGMVSCNNCFRHFTSDRINLHQEICAKTTKKKRKVFDTVKHRLKGTEAEVIFKNKKTSKTTTWQSPMKVTAQIKKTDWRKQHEEFITNIRNAKRVKNHLDKGGKLSDLPAPPPMDTSHYLQCPHCLRKFNEAAAQRHIPKCANMLHNKPKVKAKTSTGSAMNRVTSKKVANRNN